MSRRLTPAPKCFTPAVLLCLALCCVALAAGCVRLPRRAASAVAQSASAAPSPLTTPTPPPVNINRATSEELERLPGIGAGLAARIVEHRERYGPFRRVEHLLAVRGISERRFAELRDRVTAD